MKLSQFKFDLPLNLIAQNPTKRREDSRLLVVDRKSGHMENKYFRDILEYYDDKDVFVVNNTKVFPARMYGRKEKTGAKIEVFLLRELNKPNRLWDVIVDPARKIRVGNKLYFGDNEELVAEVTLHTGLGTFRPIEVEDLSKHKMDAEYYQITDEACNIVNKAKTNGKRICAIGTTTMRAMESSFTAQKLLKPSEGWTNHFIHPPYNFNVADSLVTNFHLPKTSLLIMTCAFAGYDLAIEAYKKAIKDKYRFFSYGDALLII